MNFEKLVNSKLNVIADWIIRLVMLNILMIFTSLAVVTIYPSLSAGYNMFNDYLNKKDVKLFRGYFGYFKESIGRKMILTIIIGVFFAIGYSNTRYYTVFVQDAEIFYTVGYYVTLTVLVILFTIVLYSFSIIRVFPTLKFMRLFKVSFYLAGKYYFVSLGLVVVTLLPMILLFYPQLMLLYILVGVSLPVILNSVLTKNVVKYIQTLGENNETRD